MLGFPDSSQFLLLKTIEFIPSFAREGSGPKICHNGELTSLAENIPSNYHFDVQEFSPLLQGHPRDYYPRRGLSNRVYGYYVCFEEYKCSCSLRFEHK
jgi:hypothetical protein